MNGSSAVARPQSITADGRIYGEELESMREREFPMLQGNNTGASPLKLYSIR